MVSSGSREDEQREAKGSGSEAKEHGGKSPRGKHAEDAKQHSAGEDSEEDSEEDAGLDLSAVGTRKTRSSAAVVVARRRRHSDASDTSDDDDDDDDDATNADEASQPPSDGETDYGHGGDAGGASHRRRQQRTYTRAERDRMLATPSRRRSDAEERMRYLSELNLTLFLAHHAKTQPAWGSSRELLAQTASVARSAAAASPGASTATAAASSRRNSRRTRRRHTRSGSGAASAVAARMAQEAQQQHKEAGWTNVWHSNAEAGQTAPDMSKAGVPTIQGYMPSLAASPDLKSRLKRMNTTDPRLRRRLQAATEVAKRGAGLFALLAERRAMQSDASPAGKMQAALLKAASRRPNTAGAARGTRARTKGGPPETTASRVPRPLERPDSWFRAPKFTARRAKRSLIAPMAVQYGGSVVGTDDYTAYLPWQEFVPSTDPNAKPVKPLTLQKLLAYVAVAWL